MLNIQRKISNYNYSSRNGQRIQYIVLHYTGNISDKAISNVNYFNECDRGASAHLFVDETSIWQSVELENSAWAVGGGTVLTASNRNSISIEMCCSGNYEISEITENNTIELVRYLMTKYNIDINHIIRHYDCNTIRKVCPNWSDNSWSRWYNFKNKLTKSTKYSIGWNEDNYGWFYSTDGNDYYKDCWKNIKDKYYYFDSNGYIETSKWKLDNGKWYYLDQNGEMIQAKMPEIVKWCNIGNRWYCFATDGVLYVDCITNDGYTVDSNGEWIQSIPRK